MPSHTTTGHVYLNHVANPDRRQHLFPIVRCLHQQQKATAHVMEIFRIPAVCEVVGCVRESATQQIVAAPQQGLGAESGLRRASNHLWGRQYGGEGQDGGAPLRGEREAFPEEETHRPNIKKPSVSLPTSDHFQTAFCQDCASERTLRRSAMTLLCMGEETVPLTGHGYMDCVWGRRGTVTWNVYGGEEGLV